ncbi:MAG: enolase C-terminal domain-like protein [Caldilineaceae bacterium]
MMKIKTIRAVQINLPRPQPKTPARRPSWNQSAPRALPLNKYPEFSRLPGALPGLGGGAVWVQVIAEDGTWGLGQCSFGRSVAAVVDDVFAPLLVGRDCFATEFLNDLMWRAMQRLGSAGHAAVAQSGVDLALWDLKGKLLGQPVYRLLGGPCRDKIKLYATGDDLDWAQELGFTAFKVTNPAHYAMGEAGLNLLEAKIAKARETVGPNAELMLNAVMSYNLTYAVQVAERLRPYRLHWLEEPLIPPDLEGHIALKKAVPWLPIATGEDHHGRHAFRQLVEQRCVDVLQPDINWCGGLSEAVKIYTLGEAAGLPTIPHGGANNPFGQHFALTFPESPLAEFWLGTDPGVPLAELCPLPGMAMPKAGYVTPSDAPGFGLEIRAEWIGPFGYG